MKKSINVTILILLLLGVIAPMSRSAPPPEAAAENDVYNDSSRRTDSQNMPALREDPLVVLRSSTHGSGAEAPA